MRRYIQYLKDYYNFRNSLDYHQRRNLEFRPSLKDHDDQAGSLGSHYFWQDLFMAAQIHKRKPKLHLDIGSRIDGFISSISLFTPVHVMDVRPLSYKITTVTFIQNDLTQLSGTQKYHSISCLHTIEHIGLGRYEDRIDQTGDLKAIQNIGKIAHHNASIYISTPIGRPKIKFNKHRINCVRDFTNMFFNNGFSIQNITLLNDNLDTIGFQSDVSSADAYGKTQNYSCGLFEFSKC